MYLRLHTAVSQLTTQAPAIQAGWQSIMGAAPQPEATAVTAHLHLNLVDSLPPWPRHTPCYSDPNGIIEAFVDGSRWWLHYPDGALVAIPQAATPDTKLEGWLTPAALNAGRLEDITFTALAPLLRRQGIYLVHAFAASRNGRSLLIVGPSGSGKTTTGLWLLQQGWQLLANDVVALANRNGQICATTTPNLLGIRPPTLSLLPQLAARLNHPDPTRYQTVPTHPLQPTTTTAPVSDICFVQLTDANQALLTPLPRALALAQLMQESVDRWDTAVLPTHIAFLTQLSAQAALHPLAVGSHPDTLHAILPQLNPKGTPP